MVHPMKNCFVDSMSAAPLSLSICAARRGAVGKRNYMGTCIWYCASSAGHSMDSMCVCVWME